MTRIIRFNESINPFNLTKDYSVKSLMENMILINYNNKFSFLKGLKIDYIGDYEHYERKNPGTTFSQYKKYLNRLFVDRLVVMVYYSKEDSFIIKIKIGSVSIDKSSDSIKSFKDIYGTKYLYEGGEIIDVNNYVEILKTLIGQNISFERFTNKGGNHKMESVNNFKLKDVYIDKHTNICFVDDNGQMYMPNIFHSIRKSPIISEMDPFGEEEWDDDWDITNEGIFSMGSDDDDEIPSLKLAKEKYFNFSQFLNFELLGLKKLNRLRDSILNHYIVISQKEKLIKGRTLKVSPVKVMDEQYYIIKLMTSKGEKEITITSTDKFKIKKEMRSKIDPYNEEDWELFNK